MNSIELKKELKQIAMSIDESDIDWIIVDACKISRSQIYLGESVSEEAVHKAKQLLTQRLSGRPLSQVFGFAEFYGRRFKVNENVLSPRCETEELVQLVLRTIKSGRGLDIGAGSGAIAITLKLENVGLEMVAVDVSEKALEVAKSNANSLGGDVEFIKSNLFESLNGKFDFIVSNPPYIKSGDIASLQSEVRDFEPHLALDGGEDGLDFYRRIVAEAPDFLNAGGYIFFEVGINQANDVKKLLEKDFCCVTIIKDVENIERIVYAKLR